ncbi:MAG: hypothetical protein IIB21_00280 [Chloroflexi bacterium]|nr:hypothetical protein [Chloroflexota bacterium]
MLGTSTVSVRFLFQGEPIIVARGAPLVSANGQNCPFASIPEADEGAGWGISWPVTDDPPPCAETGTTLQICFGSLCVQTLWEGEDVTVELEFPRPPGASLVTARFVDGSTPVSVSITDWDYLVQGETCIIGQSRGPVVTTSVISRFWPARTDPTTSCGDSGAAVSAVFLTEEFGEIQGSFVWTGQDVVFDVPVSEAQVSDTPTAEPPGLPSTGAAYPEKGSHETSWAPWLSLALLLAAFTLLLLGAAVNSLTGSDSDGGRSTRPST